MFASEWACPWVMQATALGIWRACNTAREGVLVDERLLHRVECAIGGRQPLDRRDRLAHRGRLASGSSARAGRRRAWCRCRTGRVRSLSSLRSGRDARAWSQAGRCAGRETVGVPIHSLGDRRHRCCPRAPPSAHPHRRRSRIRLAEPRHRAPSRSAHCGASGVLSCSGPVDRSVIIILPKVEKRLPARPQFPWK